MKKLLLSISVAIGLTGVAQTLTQANHAPAVGNLIYATYQCDSTGISPGSTGAGQSWTYNISGLNTQQSYTTQASGNAAFNPADVAVTSATNNTSYYKSSSSNLGYYGGDISIGAIDLTVKYASPAIYAVYPMSLNTTTTSITSGSVTVFGQNGTFNGTCTVIADATGTLTLPSRTFNNIVRVNTVQRLTANIGGFITATITLNNYDYYDPTPSKAPIFTISTSTISSSVGGTSTQTITSVLKDYDVVSVKENSKTIELSLYPNPATTFIELMTESKEAANVTVYDLTGKVVAKQAMEAGKTKVNLEHLSAGNYMYSVSDKTNNILKTGTFIINK